MWRRSIITPVSTILLQDNSLKPAEKRAFFLPPVFWPMHGFARCHVGVTLIPYNRTHLPHMQPICVVAGQVCFGTPLRIPAGPFHAAPLLVSSVIQRFIDSAVHRFIDSSSLGPDRV
jgi:hypothetical protein